MDARRRSLLFAAAGALPPLWLGGCAEAVRQAQADAMRSPVETRVDSGGPVRLAPWRSVQGGFLAPVVPALGAQARPGTGMYVRLQAPSALALRGQELLIADHIGARLWRADLAFNTLTPVAGAPLGQGVALLMGADYSAWVLDPVAAQVLRFARDGRLVQTLRPGATVPAPTSMALADGGATLLVGDAGLAQWAELRSGGALAIEVRPRRADGGRISGVDALAVGAEHVYALDRVAGVVHRIRRDGEVVESLGPQVLRQPGSLALDRRERVYVLDALGRDVTVLRSGAEPQVFTAAQLGATQLAGLCVDESTLCVSDRQRGQVLVHSLLGN